MSLRIAQIAPLWMPVQPSTYGGIETIVHLLCERLVQSGHQVTLFASGTSETTARLVAVHPTSLVEAMDKRQAYVYEYYAAALMIEAIRASGEFDVVHAHIGAQWIPLAALTRTPSLFTLHTSLTADDSWMLQRYTAQAVAGVSHSQLRPVEHTRPRGIPVVYNSCDFASYEPRFERGEYLAFLGRMSAFKNPLDAIRIARRIGMPIVLAGRPGDRAEKEYFASEILPLIDDNHVRYIGPVDHGQKNRFLREAAGLLFPVMWDEPFGLVMVEAMACGTPVIAYARGSVPEVVDTGITGFHGDSVESVAALVPRALGLDRRAIRAHAATRFGLDGMVDAYLALYRSLAGHRE